MSEQAHFFVLVTDALDSRSSESKGFRSLSPFEFFLLNRQIVVEVGEWDNRRNAK